LPRRIHCRAVLSRVLHFVSSVIQCDSCFIYVLENDELVLRASKNPHADVVDRLKLRVGQGITGWVAEHRQPVAVGCHAFEIRGFRTSTNCRKTTTRRFSQCPCCPRQPVAVIILQHTSSARAQLE
jgi:uroporphyrinogen-III synthase